MRRFLSVLLCALPFALMASPWRKWPSIGTFAAPGGGTATILLDTHSITRHKDFWTARQEVVFTTVQSATTGGLFQSELDMYAYDCKADRAALVSYTRYEGNSASGTVVEELNHSSPTEYEWNTPAAGSALDAARKLTCDLATLAQGS